jgi:CRISPR system Cascade subunit CasA
MPDDASLGGKVGDPGEFNLVDVPWIPLLGRDGVVREHSLRGTFRTAAENVEIVGEVPTQSFAILRLLLAVLHRAIDGPRDRQEWQGMRARWPQATGQVHEYLGYFRGRFDLFHQQTPFFQTADLRTAKGEVSGLEKLVVDVPNGAPFFTMRVGRGLERITAAEAARWLVHVQAFDPSGIRSGAVGDPRVKGGKGYPIGPGWAGQIGGVHLLGETLLDALLLNLVAWSESDLQIESGPEDLPPWERPPSGPSEETEGGREPRGPIDLYTWQTRRVRLCGGSDGVTGLVLAQGDRMTPQNRQTREPMTTWRYSEPQTKKFKQTTYMPLLHEADTAFWRGLEGMLPETVASSGSAPARRLAPTVVRWSQRVVGDLEQRGVTTVRARAVGLVYGSNNSVVEEMIDDRLEIPVSLLDDPEGRLREVAVDAIRASRGAVNALAGFAVNLAEAAGVGKKEKEAPQSRAAERAYAALDRPFRRWLASLNHQESAQEATVRWQEEARAVVWQLHTELADEAGPAAWVGRRVGKYHVDTGTAEHWFRRKLSEALPHGFPQVEPDGATTDSTPTEGARA